VTRQDENSSSVESGTGETPRSPSALVHMLDLKLTVVILIICGIFYYLTTQFEEVSPLLTQNIPPEWFPRLLLWSIVVLSVSLPFEHRFIKGGKERLDSDRLHRIPSMVLITIGLLSVVVASVYVVGTFFAMIFVCAALPLLWGERRWKILVPYAIIFPLIIAFIFTQVLRVYFQPGLYGISF
jgi:putative tricarboxylic transport membrane protein